jgi:hypothetical protein
MIGWQRQAESSQLADGLPPTSRLRQMPRNGKRTGRRPGPLSLVSMPDPNLPLDLPYGWWAREPLTEGRLFHGS